MTLTCVTNHIIVIIITITIRGIQETEDQIEADGGRAYSFELFNAASDRRENRRVFDLATQLVLIMVDELQQMNKNKHKRNSSLLCRM